MNQIILTILLSVAAPQSIDGFQPLEEFPLKVHPCLEKRYQILKGRLFNREIEIPEFKRRFHHMIDEANGWMDAIDKRRNGQKYVLIPSPHEFNNDPTSKGPVCDIDLRLPKPRLPLGPRTES